MIGTRSAYQRGVFDRTPPQNVEAERSVLGAMLLNPAAVGAAIEILRDSGEAVFYHPPNGLVYDAMVSLFGANQPIDAITLIRALTDTGKLEAAGGAMYLAELTRAVPTSANVEVYARIVLDAAILRNIIATGTRLVSEAYAAETPPMELLGKAESELFAMTADSKATSPTTAFEVLSRVYETTEKAITSGRGSEGVLSGHQKLDNLLSGFQPSDFIVIAARPSVGKTAFALSCATHAALKLDVPTLVFSLEMSEESLMMRVAASTHGVDKFRIYQGFQPHRELDKLRAARDASKAWNLTIIDKPSISILDIRSRARKFAAKHAGKRIMIIIDYLQLVAPANSRDPRHEQVSNISRTLKGLARELHQPVIALAQLNREGDTDEPKLSNLRETGAIEQDADVVGLLHREKGGETDQGFPIIFHVAKHRNGPTGRFTRWFDKSTQSYFDTVNDVERPDTPPHDKYTPDPNIADTYDEQDDMAF
jgi:replicative DNA helicase